MNLQEQLLWDTWQNELERSSGAVTKGGERPEQQNPMKDKIGEFQGGNP